MNEIKPFPNGNMIWVGKYSSQIDRKLLNKLVYNKDRKPYLVIEIKNKKPVLRAAQNTLELALKYVNNKKCYLIHPVCH